MGQYNIKQITNPSFNCWEVHSVKDEKTIYGLEEKVLISLKKEFSIASREAEKSFMDTIKNTAESNPLNRIDTSHNFTLSQLQFLFNGAQGIYQPYDSFSTGATTLWGDYLQSIGRRVYGWDCLAINGCTINKLIKQNGPKKMEKRLTNYLRRRIKNAQNQCKTSDPFPMR